MTRLPPMRPGPRMPLNTREGVAEAPIEPGARTLCEPWLTGPGGEVVALDRALEALALRTPETFTIWPGSKASTRHLVADLELAGLVAELGQVAQRRARPPS